MFRRIVFLIIPLFFLVSCGNYQRLLKSPDYELKYQMAIKYFQQGDYFKAMQLFDQLIPMVRGTERTENIYYYYAYCYYEQGDNLMASYYFKRFAKDFPGSARAEECYYMSAYCMYLDSPHYNLDQTSTLDAIKELQLFINLYPNSEKVAKANDLIDELRVKLEIKDYEIALLYYKMEEYKAAITTFNNVLKDYPDTKYREDALFYIAKANFKYASQSVPSKKKERFRATMDATNAFLFSFPGSNYMKELQAIRKSTSKALNNL